MVVSLSDRKNDRSNYSNIQAIHVDHNENIVLFG